MKNLYMHVFAQFQTRNGRVDDLGDEYILLRTNIYNLT
jgi:hypothetical protein